MLRHHAETPPQGLHLHRGPGARLPAEFIERRERQGPRQGFEAALQVRPRRPVETLGVEVRLDAGDRRPECFDIGQEVRGNRPRSRLPPFHPIEQVLDFVAGAQHRRTRRRPQGESAQPPQRFSLRCPEEEVGALSPGSARPGRPVGRRFGKQASVTQQALRQRSAEPQPVPAHRKPDGVFVPGVQIGDAAERLEAGVQHRRMDRLPDALRSGRQLHLAERLGGAGPEGAEPPERGSVVESAGHQLPVAAGHLDRRQRVPHPLQVGPFVRLLDTRRTAHPARGVARPGRRFGDPAGYRPVPSLPPTLRLQHELHEPAGAFLRSLGQHQRPFDAHVVHLHRSRSRAGRCEGGGGLGAVKRPGHHDPAEDPVVRQPGRPARAELDLEGHLPGGERPGDAQQRMPPAETPAGRRLHPVPPPLERVRRQGDPPAALAGVESRKRHRQPRLVGARHRRGEPGIGTEARDGRRTGVPVRSRPGERRERAERRPGAHLDQHFHPEFRERPQALREADRGARLPPPPGAVQDLAGRHRAARDAAHQRPRGGVPTEFRGGLREFREHRVQQRAVERVAGPETLRPQAGAPESLRRPRQRLAAAAHHAVGPVLGGDLQVRERFRFRQHRTHPVRRREDRRHPASRRERSHERAAAHREPHPRFQPEAARLPGRRDLPRSVPEHGVRNHPGLAPQRRERRRQREERRLGEGRPLEIRPASGGGRRFAEHRGEQRLPPFLPEHRLAAVQHGARRRLPRVEIATRPGPGSVLPGVEERHPAARGSRRRRLAVCASRLDPAQPLPEFQRVAENDRLPHREVAPPRPRRPGEVREPFLVPVRRGGIEVFAVFPRQRGERRAGPAGEREHPRLARFQVRVLPGDGLRDRGGDGDRRSGGRPRRLHAFEDHVRVRPREPERTDRRARRPAGDFRPRRRLRRDPHRKLLPLDPGVRRLEVQVRRQVAVAHREQRLHHPGDPRRRLQVPHVRLHRSEQQRASGLAALAVHRRRRPHLDRVPEFGAGPVRLQVIHRPRRHPRAPERLPDHPFLRRAVRNRQPGARSVLIHRRSEQHPQDPVAVALRVGAPLQHHHPASLPPHEPVRRRVERLAATVGRQHGRVLEEPGQLGVQDRVHSSGERQIRLAAAEGHRRLVERDQGRGTGRIHGHGRPLESQRERHPPDRRRKAGAGRRVEAARRIPGPRIEQFPVVGDRNARIDAGAAAREPPRVHPRVLEGLPAHLQQQTLLGVHELGLHGRDPEELRIEPVEVLQVRPERARLSALPSGNKPFRPAAGHRLPSLHELRPEPGGVLTPREPARHPHHRDFLLAPGKERRRRRHDRRLAQIVQFLKQAPAELRRRGIVEDERVRRHVLPGQRPVQPVPQLDRHQRVHPQIEEPPVGRRRLGEPQHRPHLFADEFDRQAFPLRGRRGAEPGSEITGFGARGFGARILAVRVCGQFRNERRKPGSARRQCRPVRRHHRAHRNVLPEQPPERPEGLGATQPLESHGRHQRREAFPLGLPPADTPPRSPDDRLSRESPRPPVQGERFEEDVRRRVVRLPRGPEETRHAREQHEAIQFERLGGQVEVPGPQHLRRQDPLEPRPVLPPERGVRQDPDAVEDAAERRETGVGADPGDDARHRLRVRHVADLHADLAAPVPQPGDLGFRVRARRPPAAEHDRPRLLLDQPARGRQPDPPESARHQITPVRAYRPRRRRLRRPRPGVDQAGHPAAPLAPRHLPFPDRTQQLERQLRRPRPRRGLGVQIHQPDRQVRDFLRHDPPETPEQRPRQRPRRLPPHHLSPPRHEPEPRTR